MNEISVKEMHASARGGALATAIGAGVDLVESVVFGTFTVAKTARSEVFAMAGAAVDWAELVPRSGFKLTREIVARLDTSTRAALDGGEAVAGALSRAVREAGTTVTDLVSRTSASLMGEDASRRAA